MLQKLENVYLAILRFVVIVVAGVLLIAVVFLVFNSFKALQSQPSLNNFDPNVSADSVIKRITSKEVVKLDEDKKWDEKAKKTDPNNKYYEQAANSIIKFVKKHAGEFESLNKAHVITIIKNRADAFDDVIITENYAKGFASTIEKTLSSPKVNNLADKESPFEIVDKALNFYTDEFTAKIAEEKVNGEIEAHLHEARKAEAMQSLYIAAGAFGTFLMIVFISIIIRIERNLRHLENVSRV